jgi:hypothetical protein
LKSAAAKKKLLDQSHVVLNLKGSLFKQLAASSSKDSSSSSASSSSAENELQLEELLDDDDEEKQNNSASASSSSASLSSSSSSSSAPSTRRYGTRYGSAIPSSSSSSSGLSSLVAAAESAASSSLRSVQSPLLMAVSSPEKEKDRLLGSASQTRAERSTEKTTTHAQLLSTMNKGSEAVATIAAAFSASHSSPAYLPRSAPLPASANVSLSDFLTHFNIIDCLPTFQKQKVEVKHFGGLSHDDLKELLSSLRVPAGPLHGILSALLDIDNPQWWKPIQHQV